MIIGSQIPTVAAPVTVAHSESTSSVPVSVVFCISVASVFILYYQTHTLPTTTVPSVTTIPSSVQPANSPELSQASINASVLPVSVQIVTPFTPHLIIIQILPVDEESPMDVDSVLPVQEPEVNMLDKLLNPLLTQI